MSARKTTPRRPPKKRAAEKATPPPAVPNDPVTDPHRHARGAAPGGPIVLDARQRAWHAEYVAARNTAPPPPTEECVGAVPSRITAPCAEPPTAARTGGHDTYRAGRLLPAGGSPRPHRRATPACSDSAEGFSLADLMKEWNLPEARLADDIKTGALPCVVRLQTQGPVAATWPDGVDDWTGHWRGLYRIPAEDAAAMYEAKQRVFRVSVEGELVTLHFLPPRKALGRSELRVLAQDKVAYEREHPGLAHAGVPAAREMTAREMGRQSAKMRGAAVEAIKPAVLQLWADQRKANPAHKVNGVDTDTADEWNRRAEGLEKQEKRGAMRITESQVRRWRRKAQRT